MNQTLTVIIQDSGRTRINDTYDRITNSFIGLYWFQVIAACLLYGLGFLGNLLALLIFSSLEEFRKISTGVLFLLIAIFNFFNLSTSAIESFALYGYYLFSNVFFQCRFNPFIKNISQGMSIYLSVGIAIDRLIRSEMPMYSRRICTSKYVYQLTILFLIVFSVYWSFYLLPFSYQDSTTKACYYNQTIEYYFFLVRINIPLRAILFCLIPVIIMAIANIRMLNNIRRSRHRISNGISTLHPHAHKPHRSSTAIDRILFYIMIANVSIFIITQIPFHIFLIIESYIARFDNEIHLIMYGILLLWSSIYFGIAFYLYCLGTPLFRRKFIDLTKKLLCYEHEPRG